MSLELQTETRVRNDMPAPPHGSTTLFGAAILLGAFLLFAVQLILGKFFLPWFGGTPAMWTTCMFFFQMLLLAGYAYSHTVVSRLNPQHQARLQILILIVSLLLLIGLATAWHVPLTPSASWKPQSIDHPAFSLVILLLISAGLPYFVLSTTGPLLQSWFTASFPGRSPYRLYALSNFGSLLALLSYPVLIEPWLTLKAQAWTWAFCFLAYAAITTKLAVSAVYQPLPNHTEIGTGEDSPSSTPNLGIRILWLSLAAAASISFLATTNQICQDVAVVPFLWVLPLSLYLLSFVICFDAGKWYKRQVFHPLFAASIFAVCVVINGGLPSKTLLQIAIYSLALFATCMICHGELALSKPSARHLTSFYLMIALGGAVGGTFVALIAPRLFHGYWELQFGIWLSTLLFFCALARDRASWPFTARFGLPVIAALAAGLPGFASMGAHGLKDLPGLIPLITVLIGAWLLARNARPGFDPARARAVPYFCAVALIVLGAVLLAGIFGAISGAAALSRNFYGVLTVRELNPDYPDAHAFTLMHGRVAHGYQFRAAPRSKEATGYYAVNSGVGRSLTALSALPHPLNIGLVGLGIGTLAAYARPQDQLRIYEINPEVVRLANDPQFFTYLRNCPATVHTMLGDARLSLDRELQQQPPQNFDLLAIDAFTGDAIPVHLLTQEAFQIYLAHMRTDGIIAVHITNTTLDLRPVLLNVARQFNLSSLLVHDAGDGMVALYSDWVLLARNPQTLQPLRPFETLQQPPLRPFHTWTDNYSNLLQVIRR
jgi:hypothetical protein